MIKKILFATILVYITLNLTAQYKPMVFGLRAGVNIDWMNPDATGYSSEGAKAGFAWGLIADFFFMENYSILTGFNVQYLHGELSYPSAIKKVIDGDTMTVNGILDRTYNLRYIQIPVSLKMQAEVSEKVALFGKIGIGTAFRLRAKAEDSFTGEDDQVIDKENDISDEVNFMRESFLIGGGAKITLKGSTALIIDITYDNGFGNILKGNNQKDPTVENRAILNFLEFGAGIVF